MARIILLLIVLALAGVASGQSQYLVGTGIFDLTGPASRVNMMGMAQPEQITEGIWNRLFARAYAFADLADTTRMVYVSADICFVPGGVTEAVVNLVQQKLGADQYSFENIMLSGTHTHSGPGGYSTETLYDITSLGFVKKNFDTIVQGLAAAIIQAHQTRRAAVIKFNVGTLLNTNANRSPYSYTFNKDADLYEYNVDKNMTVVRFEDPSTGKPFAMIAHMPVHGTSLNNTNTFISGDNKGFASWYVETVMDPATMPGQGAFVAAFAQANEGDVSPNTVGSYCQDSGLPCNEWHSTCNPTTEEPYGSVHYCYAPGPGKEGDMYQSAAIIGQQQANFALNQFNSPMANVSGPIGFRHQFIDFSSVQVTAAFSSTGAAATTCTAALGDSFAGGTTDGPGDLFIQGMNWTATSGRWFVLNSLAHVLSEPSVAQRRCQAPKPILFNAGDITFPGNSAWAATVIPLQMFQIGQLVLVAVPGEFTTMSGRRLRQQVAATFAAAGQIVHPMIAGLSNEYTHYIATPEEYTVQRYEAASTLYGPETLPAYLQKFTDIADSLARNASLSGGLAPPNYNFTRRLYPEWEQDTHPDNSPFGSLLVDANTEYVPGQTVSVQFQGASPDNNYMVGQSFLYVQLQNPSGAWQNVYSDADFQTLFHWHRTSEDAYDSTVTISWMISVATPPGQYRIIYYGTAKDSNGDLSSFTGTSSSFTVGETFRARGPSVSSVRLASVQSFSSEQFKVRP